MSARTSVKICGITNLADAELAVELGAWAIGMIFYAGSPRSCSRAQARELAEHLRRRVELCGVYVNTSMEQITRDSEELGLGLLQLHGDEGPAFCAEVARRTGARMIKAAQVSNAGDIRDLDRYHVAFHLLDAHSSRGLRGGTGESFDWRLLAGRRSRVPLILSGGLNAENVGEAISLVRPYAVDCASGTESAPGRKDASRMRAFFAAVAEASPHPAEVGEPA